jgi:hypothetical protein
MCFYRNVGVSGLTMHAFNLLFALFTRKFLIEKWDRVCGLLSRGIVCVVYAKFLPMSTCRHIFFSKVCPRFIHTINISSLTYYIFIL